MYEDMYADAKIAIGNGLIKQKANFFQQLRQKPCSIIHTGTKTKENGLYLSSLIYNKPMVPLFY